MSAGKLTPAQAAQRTAAIAAIALPLAGVVVAAWLAATHGVGAADLAITAFMYVLTMLGITAGYHRHFTHRAFQAPPAVRRLLGGLGSMACQGPLLFWVATHRRHHRFADRPGDPHSPNAEGGFWHAHVGWMFAPDVPDWARYVPDLLRDDVAYGLNAAYFRWVALGLALPALLGGLWTGTWAGALTAAVWGGLVRIALVHHATWAVNSVCHRWGGRDHDTADASANHPLVALLTLGEGWHNDHHAFPASARHGLAPWRLDPTWWVIRALAAVGLATDVILPDPARRGADLDLNGEQAS